MQRSINEVKCSKEDLDMKIVKEERAMRLYESSAVKRKNGSVVYERRQNWCLLFVILIFLISGILWAARPVLEIGSYRCHLYTDWNLPVGVFFLVCSWFAGYCNEVNYDYLWPAKE